MIYHGLFTSHADIIEEFHITPDDIGHVVYAHYDVASYEGSAFVIYIKNGKFWLVEGSHCSCFGLEDQWEPEEMPLPVIDKIVESNMFTRPFADEIKERIRSMDDHGIMNSTPENIPVFLKMFYG